MEIKVPETITDFIKVSAKLLDEKKIPDARLNAELLLCDVLKCDRMKLYLDFEKPLSKDEIKIFKEFLKRRLRHEPLQYILGRTSFYGLDFIVDRRVLIPRQETELLVELLMKDVVTSNKRPVTIFEIGAGSGCISISVAKNLINEEIDFEIFSIDNSPEALDVANENLFINLPDEKRVRFHLKDVFEIDKLNKSFDYIISNPPYISYIEYMKLEPEVKDFEPQNALTDQKSGLEFYKRIFEIASDIKFTGKIFCEIGFGQVTDIENLLVSFQFKDYVFYDDYSGIKRILEIRK